MNTENNEMNPDAFAEHLRSLDKNNPYNSKKSNDGDEKEKVLKEKEKETLKSISSVEEQIGYVRCNLSDLPTKGRYYPTETELWVRALNTEEIRHWSSMDPQDPYDADKHLNQILLSACKFKVEGRNIGYGDICQADKFYLVLAIRDITFKNRENKISFKHICNSCGHENEVELSSQTLKIKDELDAILEKYYDNEEKCFLIKTKTTGDFNIYVPNIGMMEKIIDYIRKQETEKKKWDKAFFSCLPFMTSNYRIFKDENSFKRLELEFKGWSTKKYEIFYNLISKLEFVKEEIVSECKKCGSEVIGPFRFDEDKGGIKQIFISTIQDITDELL